MPAKRLEISLCDPVTQKLVETRITHRQAGCSCLKTVKKRTCDCTCPQPRRNRICHQRQGLVETVLERYALSADQCICNLHRQVNREKISLLYSLPVPRSCWTRHSQQMTPQRPCLCPIHSEGVWRDPFCVTIATRPQPHIHPMSGRAVHRQFWAEEKGSISNPAVGGVQQRSRAVLTVAVVTCSKVRRQIRQSPCRPLTTKQSSLGQNASHEDTYKRITWTTEEQVGCDCILRQHAKLEVCGM
ncbi:unnamed protein product [Protopolystoma xenopodis]|uniref:Uncharacterized protein n=1 Tax=Protopolystoma xenopodis TaxID=117903 RepID=A0A3S5C4H2_9PLAT|nr:unnamed protein product [Protopolystoma xenopodis]